MTLLCPESFGYDSEDYDPRRSNMWLVQSQKQNSPVSYVLGMIQIPDGRFIMTRQTGKYRGKKNPWCVSICRRQGVNQTNEMAIKMAMYLLLNLNETLYPDLEKKHLMTHTLAAERDPTKILEVYVLKWPSATKMVCSKHVEVVWFDLDTIISSIRQRKLDVTPETHAVLNMVDRYFPSFWEE